MTWKVSHQSPYDEWRETDGDTRLRMLDWFLELSETGPPVDATFDPSIGMYCSTAPTGNLVEMMIFPDVLPPLIAIFRIREVPRW